MISSLTGRVAALLSVAAVLVVLLVGWLVLVSPQRSKAAELSGQIDQTQGQIDSTQAYVSNPATRGNVRDLQRLQKVLPDDPRVSQVLRQLSAAAGAARVSVTGITPQPAVPASGGQALPIALTVQGHYFGISKFLHILRMRTFVRGTAVRGAGRLYSIDGIQFGNSSGATSSGSAGGSSSGGTGSGTISATVSLNAFVFGAGGAVVPSTDPSTSGGITTTTTSTSSSAAAPAPSP